MHEPSKPLSALPVFLIAAGLFFPVAGYVSGGPDLVGGIVFGVVALASAGAILYRRALDAKNAKSNDDQIAPDSETPP